MNRDLAILTTQRCNEKCEYCDVPNIKNPKDINLDIYLKYIDIIQDFYEEFSLTGGEIGLLNEDVLNVIFDALRKPVKLNTNGLFVKKGYYEKYKDKIGEMWYHIIRDDGVIEIEKEDLTYIIIKHRKNIDQVDKIVEKYNHLNTRVVETSLKNKNRTDLLLHDIDSFVYPPIGCRLNTKMFDAVNGAWMYCCESYSQIPKIPLDSIEPHEFLRLNKCPEYELCHTCMKIKRYRKTNIKRAIYEKI